MDQSDRTTGRTGELGVNSGSARRDGTGQAPSRDRSRRPCSGPASCRSPTSTARTRSSPAASIAYTITMGNTGGAKVTRDVQLTRSTARRIGNPPLLDVVQPRHVHAEQPQVTCVRRPRSRAAAPGPSRSGASSLAVGGTTINNTATVTATKSRPDVHDRGRGHDPGPGRLRRAAQPGPDHRQERPAERGRRRSDDLHPDRQQHRHATATGRQGRPTRRRSTSASDHGDRHQPVHLRRRSARR